jgi:F0F1-type ATP synthase membrane subunit b/b'
MVIFGNAKVAAAGLALSAAIFLLLYFTVIKPSSDNANTAVKQGEKQAQQLLNNATKQSDAATKKLKSAGVKVPAAAQAATTRAKKLADCLVTAGADTGKIQNCQAQFGG